MASAGKFIQPKISTNGLDTVGNSEIVFNQKNIIQEEVLQKATSPKIYVNSHDLTKPLFELPKYSVNDKRKPRYTDKMEN